MNPLPWLLGSLEAVQLLQLFGHFLLLSLLAVGGALTTAPEMHRYMVEQKGWLTDIDFSASVALAQAAPGPNVLFVAVLGFNAAGLAGALACLVGTLLPSTTVALTAARWGHRPANAQGLRAFTAGMAPVTIGLLLSTSWLLLQPAGLRWVGIALLLATVWAMLRTRISPPWLIAAGAVVGGLGWL